MTDYDLDLVGRLGKALLLRGERLVTAESCTGGGLAARCTDYPGSSQWFERGYVTYSNDAKRECLRVREETLREAGAVSEATALEMAEGALNASHADLAVAITGIAGPEGGGEDKPVGTICFAWARAGGARRSTQAIFPGDRLAVREQACQLAVQGLLDLLERY